MAADLARPRHSRASFGPQADLRLLFEEPATVHRRDLFLQILPVKHRQSLAAARGDVREDFGFCGRELVVEPKIVDRSDGLYRSCQDTRNLFPTRHFAQSALNLADMVGPELFQAAIAPPRQAPPRECRIDDSRQRRLLYGLVRRFQR